MTNMAYIPIDETARDGLGHCLRADDDTLHAGSWHHGRQAFVYSNGAPIQRPITHYLARLPGPRSITE